MYKYLFLVSLASATQIYKECLKATNSAGKYAGDAPDFSMYTNDAGDVIGLDFFQEKVSSNMKVGEISTCKGRNKGNLIGLEFILKEQIDNPDSEIDLPILGLQRGDCTYSEVDSSGISKIAAYMREKDG